jgi:NADH dehydrogenase
MNSEAGERFLFLTGATGHAGSRVARRMLADGWRLRCLSHSPARAKFLPDDPRLEIVPGDLTRPEAWAAKLAGAAALLHMAHVGFAEHVVAACRAAGVRRVISFSSTRRFTRFPEATARRVIAGEAAFEASDLNCTILRASMIYGGDRDNNVEKLVKWLRRRRWVPLVAGGRNRVQPIFTWDLVDAVARALARPDATRRRALTIAGPEPLTQRAMIETVGRAMGRPPIFVQLPYWMAFSGAAIVQFFAGHRLLTTAQVRRQLEEKVFDIDEAREALGGWTPRSFEEGVRLKIEGKA